MDVDPDESNLLPPCEEHTTKKWVMLKNVESII